MTAPLTPEQGLSNGLPRYYVGEITGYPINPNLGTTSSRKAKTFYMVYDRVDRCSMVREYKGREARERANELCRWLNLEEQAVLHLRALGFERA
jgi:hypothetical protein